MSENKLNIILKNIYQKQKTTMLSENISETDYIESFSKLVQSSGEKTFYEWLYKSMSLFLYIKASKYTYEAFKELGYTYSIDKNMYNFFHSLHRKNAILDEMSNDKTFKLIEALEALNSYNFRIVELKKWSKWLTKVFDEKILHEYIKYIPNPITYFLVVIRDTLKPLKNKKNDKNLFFSEIKKIQDPFHDAVLENEEKYKKLFKKINKLSLKEKVEFTDFEKKVVKPLKEFDEKYGIELIRVFQFFSFPFFIDEIKTMPYDLLLEFSDNLIVYSENYYWEGQLTSAEFLFRQVSKNHKIAFYTKNFIASKNKLDDDAQSVNRIVTLLESIKDDNDLNNLLNAESKAFKNTASEKTKEELSFFDGKENNLDLIDDIGNAELVVN